MIFRLLIKDERGNGILLFALMLLIIMSIVLIVEADYAKVLITKVSMSMVADIAASEAAKELNMDLASNRGVTVLNKTRASETAEKYISENKGFIPCGHINRPQVSIKGEEVKVLISSTLPLSQYNRNVVVKAKGVARIRSLSN